MWPRETISAVPLSIPWFQRHDELSLALSLVRCSLSSLFPDDSGTLEELLYDSIVEHVASALYVFYRRYVH